MLLRVRTSTVLLVILLPYGRTLAQQADPFGGADPFKNPQPVQEAAPQAPGKTVVPQRYVGDDPFGNSSRVEKKTPSKQSSGGIGLSDPFNDSTNQNTKAIKQKLVQVGKGSSSKDANERIFAALDEKTSNTFLSTPLQEAVDAISQQHNIAILIDHRALEEIGLSSDHPVVLSLKDVTLRSFLRLMLRQIDCTYIIRDEVMQITTTDAAEENLIIRSHTLSEELALRAEKIVKALTQNVVPDAWSTAGGPCSISAVDHVLVVSATSEIHDQVKEFLEMLATAFEKAKGNR